MNDSIDLRDYAKIVKKYILIVAVIFVIIIIDTIAYTHYQPRIYEASATVGIFSEVQIVNPFGNVNQKINIETYKEIIQSNTILNKVSKQTGFSPHDYEIIIDHPKNSNIIRIIIQSEKRLAASVVANAIANEFIEYNIERKQDMATNKKLFIDLQLTMYEKELDSFNKKLIYYDGKVLTKEAKLDKMNIERNIQIKSSLYNELLLKSEEIKITIVDNSGGISIIDKAIMPIDPVSPNILMNYTLGILLALFISIGIPIFVDSLNQNNKK